MTEHKIPQIDYQKLKREWNGLFERPIKDKQRWQLIALAEFVLLLVVNVGFIQVSLKSTVVPWVIQVDTLGRMQVSGPAKQVAITDEIIFQSFLYRFIELSRTVITDPTGIRKNLNEVYLMASTSSKNYLNEFYKSNNPFEIARKGSIEVLPVSFLKQSDNSFICEWKEIHRDLQSHVVEEAQFKGLFNISKSTPTEETLKRNPSNPFSIIVESLSWSSIL